MSTTHTIENLKLSSSLKDSNGNTIISVDGSTIVIGDSASTGLVLRYNSGVTCKSQLAHTALSDTDSTLTISQIKTGIITITPSANRTLTLPTSADAVAGFSGIKVDEAIKFIIINKASSNYIVTIAMGSGGTLEGNSEVNPKENTTNTYKTSGSATFKICFRNVSSSTEAYTIYRTA